MGWNLLIRADTTTQIGTGHVMRCMAMAQAWKKNGGHVTFLTYCESEILRQRIRREGFELIPVERPHPHPADLRQVTDLLEKSRTQARDPWFVIDGYHFESQYQKSIQKAGGRLLVIDDYNHLPHYHTDFLLNQNIGAEKIRYSCDSNTVLLLGVKYAVLRTEFLKWKDGIQKQPEHPRNILVTLGGADPDNVTFKVVQALLQKEFDCMDTIIVAGPANPNIKVLRQEIERARRAGIPAARAMRVLEDAYMPELMARANVAVSAGGTTCWELCFFGVPTLVIISAENQRSIALGLQQAGAALCLGWHADLTVPGIKGTLERLLSDSQIRLQMSAKGRRLVDGEGRLRVLQALYGNSREQGCGSFF